MHDDAAMANVLARLGTVPLVAGKESMCDAMSLGGVADDGVPVYVDDAPTTRVQPFTDRVTAGHLLGQALIPYARTGAVVLGVANGGVPVAQGLAQELGLALDVWLVRTLRAPSGVLPLGVISEGPTLRLDRKGIAHARLAREELGATVSAAADQLALDAARLRRRRAPASLVDRLVILVDEGIPSAALLSAAIEGVRQRGASFVVVASPVGAHASVHRLGDEADDVVCLMTPDRLSRVGAWYHQFGPVSDLAVMTILASVTAP